MPRKSNVRKSLESIADTLLIQYEGNYEALPALLSHASDELRIVVIERIVLTLQEPILYRIKLSDKIIEYPLS